MNCGLNFHNIVNTKWKYVVARDMTAMGRCKEMFSNNHITLRIICKDFSNLLTLDKAPSSAVICVLCQLANVSNMNIVKTVNKVDIIPAKHQHVAIIIGSTSACWC